MARSRRSQTNISAPNQGMGAIKNQSFNHMVSPIESSQVGLDPFRGDLTNAFENFFGGLQNAMQNFQEAEMIVKKQEAKTYADNMAKQAKALATDKYMEQPTMGTGDINVLVDGLDEDQRGNRHFLTTFKDTLGANIGDRMYGDFALHMSTRPAASFDSEALKWWEKNYGNGTGDPVVDTAMQGAWARNFETARVVASGETIKQQKQQATDELLTDVYRRVATSNFSHTDFASIVNNFATNYPNETTGQHNARALGALKNASIAAGPSKTQKFLAFLDEVPTDGQSYAQRFPKAVADIKAQTYDALLQHTTMGGMDAYKSSASLFASIQSDEDEYNRLEAATSFLATELPKLMNTPGVPVQQVNALKSKVVEEILELKNYALTINQIKVGSVTGKFDSSLDVDDITKYGHEAIMREADWFNVDPSDTDAITETTFNASNMIRSLIDRFGEKSISDDTKQLFTAGLLSADVSLQTRTANILKAIDGTGDVGRILVAHDARAAMIYDTAIAPTISNQDVNQSLSVVNTPEFQTSMEQIKEAGIETKLYPGEKSADAKIKFQEDFFGDDMAEDIQEALGMDGIISGWGSPNISPMVEEQIRKLADVQLAKLRATGQDWDVDALRDSIIKTLKPSLYIDNDVVKMNSGPESASDREGSSVPLGNNVYNPNSGTYEDTAATLREDVQTVKEGMVGIYINGDEMDDYSDEIYDVVKDPRLAHENAYLVITANTGMPLTIGLNQEYEVNEDFTYDEEGNLQEKGWFMSWWDDTKRITFTGDREMDAMKASLVFGQGVALYPTMNLNGQVLGYNIVVRPRFTEGAEKWTIEQIEENAQSPDFFKTPTPLSSGVTDEDNISP